MKLKWRWQKRCLRFGSHTEREHIQQPSAETVTRNAWSCYIATVVDFSINDDQLLNSIQ